jgi:uncharacterized protein YqjF (DUF2071 family)
VLPLPPIEGVIDRRLLVNYRVDPEIVGRLLPQPFRPQVVHGYGVAGICLLRMAQLRPRALPAWLGLRSENAAHRIAVEWDTPEGSRTGVYIPRRDSASLTNVLVGGRIFPGTHHRARFEVSESEREVAVHFASVDGTAEVDVRVERSDELSGSELFADLDDASRFFRHGSVGYSTTRDPHRLEGLELRTDAWAIEAASVVHARSSFFEDATLFPEGSATLDSAMLMLRVPVRWYPQPPLDARGPVTAPVADE